MTSEHSPASPPATSPPAASPPAAPAVPAAAAPAAPVATTASAAAPTHRFIVLEGPVGVGKTTLAGKLAETLGAELVLERADNNPFLERFYRNPRAGALAAQLYFLFQRTQQLSALQQHDMFAPMRIADYLIDKDRLFARTTLDDEEYRLYEQVYARLAIEAPKPDLVIYLQAPVDVLLGRISRRAIPYEQFIDRRYLERLNDAYARFFHEYEASPLLIVNAAAIDPVGSEADFAELLAAIQRMRRGRLYYNPLRHGAL
jgi:deoxyguanosine kinase